MGSARKAHRALGPALLVTGTVSMVGGALLPWVATGERQRNSFEIVRAGRALGVLDHGVEKLAGQGWYLVPVVAALALLGLAVGCRRTAAALGAVAAAAAVAMALVVRATSFPARFGIGVTMGAAVLAVIGAALTAGRDKEQRS